MMRGLVAAGLVVATLSACSEPNGASPAQPSPAPQPTAGSVRPAEPVAGPSSSGGLTGEVSGLSGEITSFRVERTATQTIVEIASDVLFAFDSATLSPTAPAQLSRAADLIRQGGPGPIAVRGYTDFVGDDAYNFGLSERRALEVAGWLITSGRIERTRLRPSGLGEADPVAPNAGSDGQDNPEGRALNRRVVIVIPRV